MRTCLDKISITRTSIPYSGNVIKFFAGVAQLAECRSPKPKVAGSNPVAGATGQFQQKLTFLFDPDKQQIKFRQPDQILNN